MNQTTSIRHNGDATKLNRISLVSDCSKGVGTIGLMRLYFKAYTDSMNNDVTGLFICDGSKIGQVLEGDGDGIQACWESIANDPLHENICIYEKQPIAVRLYDGWSMHIKDGLIMTLMYPQCRPVVNEINTDSTEEVLGIMHSYAAMVKHI